MIKKQVNVGGGPTRLIESSKILKSTKKAFSIAEAMIALLIGSLILGVSAPMISKQMKHNNFSDVQVQIINKKIEQMSAQNKSLLEEVERLKAGLENVEIPANTIAFLIEQLALRAGLP